MSQAASSSSIDRSQHESVLKTRLHQLQQQLFEEARRLLVDNDQQVQQRYEEILQQQQALFNGQQQAQTQRASQLEAELHAQAQRASQLEAELQANRTRQQQRAKTQKHVVVQLAEQCRGAVRQLRVQQRGVQRSQEELGAKARLIMHAGMNQVSGSVACLQSMSSKIRVGCSSVKWSRHRLSR